MPTVASSSEVVLKVTFQRFVKRNAVKENVIGILKVKQLCDGLSEATSANHTPTRRRRHTQTLTGIDTNPHAYAHTLTNTQNTHTHTNTQTYAERRPPSCGEALRRIQGQKEILLLFTRRSLTPSEDTSNAANGSQLLCRSSC